MLFQKKQWPQSAALFLALVIFLVPSIATAEQEKRVLRIGYGIVEGFIESETQGAGVEILNEVVSRLERRGYKVEKRLYPFKRVLAAFMARNLDLAFPIVSAERFTSGGYKKWGFVQIPLYSGPLYNGGNFIIYSRKDQPRFNSTKELKGKSIGVIAGAFIPSDIKSPSPFKVVEIKSGEQAFKMLQRSRIDVFLVHNHWAQGILNGVAPEGLHHGVEFGDIFGGFISQQTNRGAEVLSEINQIIGAMIIDGSYAEIAAKYPESKLVIRYPPAQ